MSAAPFSLDEQAAHARRIDAQGADYADLDDARWLATVRERDAKIARLEKEIAAVYEILDSVTAKNAPNALAQLHACLSGAHYTSKRPLRAAYAANAAAALRDLENVVRTARGDLALLETEIVDEAKPAR